jgi:predicted naringenin-chalcone synthase
VSFAILSIGTAVPKTAVTQAESVRLTEMICQPPPDQVEQLPQFYRQTGIQKRHLCFSREIIRDVMEGTRQTESPFLPGAARGPTTNERMDHYRRHAGPLGLEAARQALDLAHLTPAAITHLVTVSCTGFGAPGVDVALIKGLKLPATVERTHVGFMGCHGALNALRVARAYTGSDPAARVLICAIELCGVHVTYGWDARRMVPYALFADGAAAVVGVPAADAVPDAWQVAASGSCLFPDSEPAMTWHIGDHGFEMTLSIRVPNLIGRHLRKPVEEWLQRHGLALADVASWAVHPGGPDIVSAVIQALTLNEEAVRVSREVLADHGNMSSPTVLFILDRLRRQDAPRPCVALAFGPGLVAEFTLFR